MQTHVQIQYMHKHAQMHMNMVDKHIHMHEYMCAHMHVCCVYMCVRAHVCAITNMCAHPFANMHTCGWTHVLVYRHKHTCSHLGYKVWHQFASSDTLPLYLE